jgi:hypothetical protein
MFGKRLEDQSPRGLIQLEVPDMHHLGTAIL